MTEGRKLLTVREWAKTHKWPTISNLYNLIFKSTENGIDCAIRRDGRRILIDETAFWDWAHGKGIVPRSISK